MYGLVNQALVALIRRDCGEETCRSILISAGVPSAGFNAMEPYPDEVTTQIVAAAADHLEESPQVFLRRFGRSWVDFVIQSEHAVYLRQSGDSFVDCLMNLDDLHGRIGAAFSKLDPPSFECVEQDDGHVMLYYTSNRRGLAPFLAGLVEGLADHFGQPIDIRQVSEESNGVQQVVFEISLGRGAAV